MIEVSAVVNSAEFAESFTIQRSNGSYLNGTWTSRMVNLSGFGVVRVASQKDIMMTPEGDVIKGDRVFHSVNPLYTTSAEHARSSDILIWEGQPYRVMRVDNASNFGYYKAICVRMKAAG
jgi:hypothetical protein